jgi:hypothetical protein
MMTMMTHVLLTTKLAKISIHNQGHEMRSPMRGGSRPCCRKKAVSLRPTLPGVTLPLVVPLRWPLPEAAPRRPTLPLAAPQWLSALPLAVPQWLTLPEARPRRSTLAAPTCVGHREKLTPAMVDLIDKIAVGCEDQKDHLTCLVHSSWKPGAGPTLTPTFVAYRTEAITMITLVHTWAVMCVGATNDASRDRRDGMHRSKGLAASSLHDNMTPCWSVVEGSFHVWSNAVGVLDKFLSTDGYQFYVGDLSDGARHKLLLSACACYVIAWKTAFATYELLFDQVYECLLEYYKSTGSNRGAETFTSVTVRQGGSFKEVQKTHQGLSLECAERYVLDVCGWCVGMSTLPEAIDAILGTKADTDAVMAKLRICAYSHAMRIIIDADAIYSSEFFVLKGAYSALGEAALVIGVPINHLGLD